MELTLYFDGACEPVNPGGTGSFGWVLAGLPDGPRRGWGAVPPAPTTTNNLCEWLALEEGLKAVAAADWVADWLAIRGDSQLVINQLTGAWRCNAANLVPLRDRCLALLATYGDRWEATWVPRGQNQEADELSVRAWVEATGKPFPERVRAGRG